MKVFWSWQSDLPGNISRFFVRDALLLAIKKINEAADIEEPSERDRLADLQLDSDRQGLPGSPDLARSILKKIEQSTIFVADVTPVDVGPSSPAGGGGAKAGRQLMNPNVAIELGYALATVTDERLLMILNTAYGGREGLPFDIAHKAGPITYNLAPGTPREAIEREKSNLVSQLVPALETIRTSIRPPPGAPAFGEIPSTFARPFYFKQGEVLAISKNDPDGIRIEHMMPLRQVFYLRMIPTKPLLRPLAMDVLAKNAGRFGAFGQTVGVYIRQNAHGMIVFDSAGHAKGIGSLTQYFRNGEIWGINADMIFQGYRGEQRWLLSQPIEHTFAESLNLYLEFMREFSHVAPPYTVEMGLFGVKDWMMIIGGATLGSGGIMYGGDIFLRDELRSTDLKAQDALLFRFFEMMFDQTGHPRPPKLYGFPPDRK